jgi:hypothetical protein
MAEKPKLSFADFKNLTSDEIAKSKTKIGEYAAEKNYYGNVLDSKQTREEKLEKVKSARDEADNEVERETRRGARKMASGGKVKKYADGGMTQQPTYPFYGNQPQAGGQNGGTNQTFNMQPQANAGAPNPQQQPMQAFKKGGKVSSASSRADGCAIRGKTRA